MHSLRAGMTHLPWLRDIGKSLRTVARIIPSLYFLHLDHLCPEIAQNGARKWAREHLT